MKKWLLLTCAVTLCACTTMTETSPMTDQTFYDVDLSISQTVKFTGEPGPASDQERVDEPPFPPAAKTWARTLVLSML